MAGAGTDLQLANESLLKIFLQKLTKLCCRMKDCLARLEASLARNKESGNEEQLKLVGELQLKLETVKAEQFAEKEKAAKEVQHLTAENAKLHYRIIHLLRALNEADSNLAAK